MEKFVVDTSINVDRECNIVPAIKVIRQGLSIGLKEAKGIADEARDEHFGVSVRMSAEQFGRVMMAKEFYRATEAQLSVIVRNVTTVQELKHDYS